MAGASVPALADEPLDALIWRATGTRAVEKVLEANRGLAQLGTFLPEGTVVLIPELAAAPAAEPELVQLWD
jgi:phage tail protein X